MYEALLELDIENLSRLLLHSRLFVLTVEICLLGLLFGDLKCVCFEGLHVLSFPRSIHLRTSPIRIMIGVYVGLSALQPVVHLIMSNNLEVCKFSNLPHPMPERSGFRRQAPCRRSKMAGIRSSLSISLFTHLDFRTTWMDSKHSLDSSCMNSPCPFLAITQGMHEWIVAGANSTTL